MTRDDPDALGADLRATVAARHELDPSYEHDLLESFLDRLDGVVADRARAEAEDRRRQEKVLRPRPALPFVLSVVSLIVGVPVTGFAGNYADLPGILAGWAGIVAVNLTFAWSQRRRRQG